MKTSTLDTAGNIYSAVGRPEAWTPLMAELCGLFKASIGIWVTPGQGQRDHSFMLRTTKLRASRGLTLTTGGSTMCGCKRGTKKPCSHWGGGNGH